MKYCHVVVWCVFCFFTSSALGASPPKQSYFMKSSMPLGKSRLVINNRPLAKIHGKVISLYDVVKKMNLLLFAHAPNYTPSSFERMQFYTTHWENILNEIIANELILLDAEHKKIKISDGEVRKELINRFGPSIHANLDKMNLEYEEARDIIRSDLTVDQLVSMKVYAKAFQAVTIEMVKNLYQEYLKKTPTKDKWTYRVLSIRGEDRGVCETLAKRAYDLLQEEGHSLDTVATILQGKGATVSASKEFSESTEKISKAHFDVIQSLTPDTISQPIFQTSRFDNNMVFRIFHLKGVSHVPPMQFGEMHDELRDRLLFQHADRERLAYIDSLKKKFGYDLCDPKLPLPEDYTPFSHETL